MIERLVACMLATKKDLKCFYNSFKHKSRDHIYTSGSSLHTHIHKYVCVCMCVVHVRQKLVYFNFVHNSYAI